MLKFFGSLYAVDITGQVLYNGESIAAYTSNPVGFWARNEVAGTVVPISPIYDSSDGTYAIYGLQPGIYGFSITIDDAPPYNGRPFPGDYRGWNSPIVVPAGESEISVDLTILKLIHLISPVDNAFETGPTYEWHEYLQDEMIFRWESIAEAARYELWLDTWQDEPYAFIDRVIRIEVEGTEAVIELADSLETQHYEFRLFAENSSGQRIGQLMIVYSNGIGWDYRFKILPAPEVLVDVDIKPRSCPNPLNFKNRGVLPIAILGKATTTDVTAIDPLSVEVVGFTFGVHTTEIAGISPLRTGLEDVGSPVPDALDVCDCTTMGADGSVDLLMKFDSFEISKAMERAFGAAVNGKQVIIHLGGSLLDGTPIRGEDCVVIVGKKPKRRSN